MSAPRGRTTNERILVVLAVGLGLLGVLWLRCVYLQAFDPRGYARSADAQHRVHQPVHALRGTISDRNGRPLALSISAPSVFADARRIAEKPVMASRLARLTGRDAGTIRQRLEKDKGFVWIARQVDYALLPTLLEMRGAGIGTQEELRRVYPQGRLAAHLLGFVNVDHQGLEGLELLFNRSLGGQDGWTDTLRDAKGDLLIGPWTRRVEPVDGGDVQLTIDSVVQQAAEEALDWGAKKFRAKGGSIIVMDPHTGEILAMANYPTYDPADPGHASPERRRNRAVTDVFEPGSVFKIVTASALLDLGKVRPEETFYCEDGSWPTVAGHVLHDAHGHGTLAFREVISLSSNIGTAKAAQRLAPDQLYGYIRAFGFGRKTGIDLPGEVSGIVPNPKTWWKVSMYNIPIGQGIAVTPIQLAVLTAAIANGGLRVTPRVIKSVRAPGGRQVRPAGRPEPERVISYATATAMQSILTDVVESGTGQSAKVEGLTVAGKTGTAQKLEPSGRYSHSRYVASFVGFGPVPDSHVVITVSMDEPRTTVYGGTVSAPMFRRIVEQLAAYWGFERAAPTQVARAS